MIIADSPRLRRLTARLSFACTTLLPSAAFAADYFVSPDGDDANKGTESKPFLTLRRGVDAASQPGDTLWLRGGVYEVTDTWENQLNLRYSGTADNPITIRNYPGELPILDGTGLREEGASAVEPVPPTEVPVEHIRVIGLVARNWGTSGFSNGWHGNDPNLSSSNLTFINCIADNNGVNGFSFTGGENLYMEGNIILHNGNLLPAWSSGVSLLEAHGENFIIGNVSFENADISRPTPQESVRATDGSGFIADEQTSHAYFANNIAFRNGGSCFRVTLSSGVTIINNTCYQNGQDSALSYNDEIYLSEQQSGNGTSIYNTIIVNGRTAVWGGNGIAQGNPTRQNNLDSNAASVLADPGAGDFQINAGSTAVDGGGNSNYAPDTDVGFDPKCIKSVTPEPGWLSYWTHAVDYEYVASVGGVAGCFSPRERISGNGIDIGAYESGSTIVGCMDDSECADDSVCTRDMCEPGHRCVHVPIENCCTTDTECDDGDECTIESCDVAANTCQREIDPVCGENVSGEWAYDSNSGFASVCNWKGFTWTAAGPEEPGINGTTSTITKTADLCYSGTVAAYEDYAGYAIFGFNINQENGAGTEAVAITPGGTGLNVSINDKTGTLIRIQLQTPEDAEGNMQSWCVELDGAGGYFPWDQFNTECWNPEGETAMPYTGEPINVISVMVAGHNVKDRDFDFCFNQFAPSAEECIAPEPTGCEGGTSMCGITCIDLQNDARHCGACGNACADGESCSGGVCGAGASCSAGLTACSGDCVNLDSNAQHCGACGNACDDDLLCSNGACSDECDEDLTVCDQACVDLQKDADHCGECGNDCDRDERCSKGKCVPDESGDGDDGDDDDGSASGADGGAGGCACNATDPRQGWAWGGLLLLGLGLRRRRNGVSRS